MFHPTDAAAAVDAPAPRVSPYLLLRQSRISGCGYLKKRKKEKKKTRINKEVRLMLFLLLP